jgi:hypothetical protein
VVSRAPRSTLVGQGRPLRAALGLTDTSTPERSDQTHHVVRLVEPQGSPRTTERERNMSKDNAQSITGKVFDTDSNPVTARLLVWGPEDVDGETCMIAEPTDFFSTAPDLNYEGDDHPTLAADDLRIAVPVSCFPAPTPLSKAAQAFIAGMVDDTGEIDKDFVFADPQVWAEAQRFFPRHLFDSGSQQDGDTWQIAVSKESGRRRPWGR